MTLPRVTELPRHLEAVTPDPFMDALGSWSSEEGASAVAPPAAAEPRDLGLRVAQR